MTRKQIGLFIVIAGILMFCAMYFFRRATCKKMDCREIATGEFVTRWVPDTASTWDTIDGHVVLKTHWEND